MESEKNVMRSKFIQGNNKFEEIFYNNKNEFESNLESDAKKVFNELLQMTFSKSNTLSLRFLRRLIENNNSTLSPAVKSFISVYKLTDQLKLGNNTLNEETGYDFELTQKDFVDLFTGKYVKDLLFESKSYEKKRHYIEEYSKLYELMGADPKGLSRKSLFETLKDALSLAYLGSTNINPELIQKEVDEILETFSKAGSDYISLADFVNIMTSD